MKAANPWYLIDHLNVAYEVICAVGDGDLGGRGQFLATQQEEETIV